MPALRGWLANTRGEADFVLGDSGQRVDHEFLFTCPNSRFQSVDGIVRQQGHPALTDDGAAVVLRIDQMYRNTGFGLARGQDRLERPIAIHPRSAESRERDGCVLRILPSKAWSTNGPSFFM